MGDDGALVDDASDRIVREPVLEADGNGNLYAQKFEISISMSSFRADPDIVAVTARSPGSVTSTWCHQRILLQQRRVTHHRDAVRVAPPGAAALTSLQIWRRFSSRPADVEKGTSQRCPRRHDDPCGVRW